MTQSQPKNSNWFGERVRYLSWWPINLVRDLPARARHLGKTGRRAIQGFLFLPAEFIGAVQFNETKSWLHHKFGRSVNWSHELIAEIFDLIGGPEIGQFFFHFFTETTPLTDDEIAMMSDIVGPDAMRYSNLRVAQGGLLDLIFRINGNLAFATWRTINIPREGRHSRENLALIAHELTHAYQYEQVGSRYLGEAIYVLIKTKRDCYDYGGPQGLADAYAAKIHYDQFNREQQAMIVQDYYSLKEIGADVSVYEPYIEELRSGLI